MTALYSHHKVQVVLCTHKPNKELVPLQVIFKYQELYKHFLSSRVSNLDLFNLLYKWPYFLPNSTAFFSQGDSTPLKMCTKNKLVCGQGLSALSCIRYVPKSYGIFIASSCHIIFFSFSLIFFTNVTWWKLYEINVFTPVCDSVHGGGCTSPRQTHPPRQTTPREDTRPRDATAADGTHPTGMHSCWKLNKTSILCMRITRVKTSRY